MSGSLQGLLQNIRERVADISNVRTQSGARPAA